VPGFPAEPVELLGHEAPQFVVLDLDEGVPHPVAGVPHDGEGVRPGNGPADRLIHDVIEPHPA